MKTLKPRLLGVELVRVEHARLPAVVVERKTVEESVRTVSSGRDERVGWLVWFAVGARVGVFFDG